MTFVVSLVVAILTLSHPAQAFRHQSQKRNVDGIPQTTDQAPPQQDIWYDAMETAPIQNTMDRDDTANLAVTSPLKQLKLEDQVFPLGTYDILEGARVAEGTSLESTEIANLEIGETVTVLKVEHIVSEQRVRAQIEQKPNDTAERSLFGWISLLDTSDGFRWAESRAMFCARVKWCKFNYDKCYWSGDKGACAALAYPPVNKKYSIVRAPTADPKTLETEGEGKETVQKQTTGTDISNTVETPEERPKASAETPATPEAPETAGKESATQRSAGTCAMATAMLLLYGLNA